MKNYKLKFKNKWKIKYQITTIFLFLAVSFSNATSKPDTTSTDRPKIGVVLSGGGAKGFAHVGTLQLLDSLHIPVDYIAGTSIGGIASVLYSIGYSGIDLENLAYRSDWQEIFTDQPQRALLPYFQKKETGKYQVEFGLKGLKPITPSGLIYGQKVSLLFSSLMFPYENITDFDRLPIPVRCIAVDLVTGNEVVLKSGSLAVAMRATMAIPTVFSPVEMGDSLLVDGGLINNLPVDVVRAMGADIVIAVDVESPLKSRSQLNTVLSVLDQTVTLLGRERKKENLERVDLLIQPDISGFSAADFDNEKIKILIERGKVAAHKKLNELIELKEKYGLYYLNHVAQVARKTKIQSLQISGQTTIPFKTIREQLNIKVNDEFNPEYIEDQIAKLKSSGNFDKLSYDVIPLSDERVRLLIRVHENEKPIIFGILIQNNTRLPFHFIYRLLGLRPGDLLDTKLLNQRIMEMYSLGYFELILYDIEPVAENKVNLILSVKELPTRRLRIGLRYDNLHKLVAAVSIQTTNLLLPGLRLENELQFAGLYRFRGKAYYPSRSLNLPAYPFLHIEYKDIPTYIFSGNGDRIASYSDRSLTVGAGVGFLLAKIFNTELEYLQEYMDIKPNVALSDPTFFPEWKHKLRIVQANMNIDMLDDVLLPRDGVLINAHYEASLKQLKSEIHYHAFHVSADFYYTFYQRHTIRTHGFWGTSTSNLPVYKFMNRGRPDMFIGMRYDQLFASRLSIVRLDYRYQHKKDIFFKLIGNFAFDAEYHLPPDLFLMNNLWGAGISLTFLSPVGPIEILYGTGSKKIIGSRKLQNVFYFTLGYKF